MNQTIRSAFLAVGLFFPAVVGIGSHVASATGCTQQEAKTIAQDVLTLADLACLLGPMIDPDLPEAAMTACRIAPKLRPIVDELLAQKKAAARAAACAPAKESCDGGKCADAGKK